MRALGPSLRAAVGQVGAWETAGREAIALEAAAEYRGGFGPGSVTVRHLWQVVHALPLPQKKAFLRFVTGSDRAPLGGLGKLRIVVQREGPDSDRLPTTHTCFNMLVMPEYTSRGKLADRLGLAIKHAGEGFGLE